MLSVAGCSAPAFQILLLALCLSLDGRVLVPVIRPGRPPWRFVLPACWLKVYVGMWLCAIVCGCLSLSLVSLLVTVAVGGSDCLVVAVCCGCCALPVLTLPSDYDVTCNLWWQCERPVPGHPPHSSVSKHGCRIPVGIKNYCARLCDTEFIGHDCCMCHNVLQAQ